MVIPQAQPIGLVVPGARIMAQASGFSRMFLCVLLKNWNEIATCVKSIS
jgi:hypothetical protein